jgi:hypothetical protein
MHNNSQQRLFWSVSKPLKYMGLTLDEWGVTLVGLIPGIILLNSAKIKMGVLFLLSGVMLCWIFKKYKRLSQSFKIKSFLIAKGLMPAPAFYPRLLKKEKVGR